MAHTALTKEGAEALVDAAFGEVSKRYDALAKPRESARVVTTKKFFGLWSEKSCTLHVDARIVIWDICDECMRVGYQLHAIDQDRMGISRLRELVKQSRSEVFFNDYDIDLLRKWAPRRDEI